MKPLLMIFVVTVLSVSTLLADEDVLGLGMVKVDEVIYNQDGEFSVTLSLPVIPATERNPLFFNNEPTLSFQFFPDKLDGVLVVYTPNQEITREDVALPGPSFLNLLLSNMASGQPLDLSCGFTKEQSLTGIESNKFVLSYFQVNHVNE